MSDINTHETKYLLCLMDVLGFENLFSKYGLQDIYHKYGQIILSAQKEKITGLRFFGQNGASFFNYKFDFAYFSDTIILWGQYDLQNLDFISNSLEEMICCSIEIGLPLRGAISVGEHIIEKNSGIYLGQPIISAARAERSQEWIGITFSKEFSQKPLCNDLNSINVLQYEKHIKDNCKDKVVPFVIDYPRHWKRTRQNSIENAIQALNTDSEHSTYYQNTIDFVEFSEDYHNENMLP
ncbi:MAG: hypothetical protein M0Q12_06995 [Synergistaceae bacterium]|nr:hypothetical protein [Synergistaceae bacterium]